MTYQITATGISIYEDDRYYLPFITRTHDNKVGGPYIVGFKAMQAWCDVNGTPEMKAALPAVINRLWDVDMADMDGLIGEDDTDMLYLISASIVGEYLKAIAL